MTRYLDSLGLEELVEKLKKYTDDAVNNLNLFIVVDSLPTRDILENKIYLVPDANAEEGNLYDEYVYVNNAWELLGKVTLDTDLSNYYTKEEVDDKLDAKQDTLSAGANVSLEGDVVSVDLSGCVTTGEMASALSEYNKTGNFKTINGNSIIGDGDITITGAGDVNLSDYVTNASLASTLEDYTKTTGFATINGQEITNGGNITIEAGGGGVDLSDYADKSTVTNMFLNSYNNLDYTAVSADDYIRVYLTAWQASSTTWGSGSTGNASSLYFAKINGNRLVNTSTSGISNLTIEDLGGYSQATITAMITDAITGGTVDLSAYLSKAEAESTYQPKGDYALKTDIPDLSNYVTTSSLTSTLVDYAKSSDIPTLSSLGGVGSVSASGTSPLTLSASKSGTSVTITGSVDLSSYVTSSSLTSAMEDYTYDKGTIENKIAEAVTGGTVSLDAYLTKAEAESTYQPIGSYLTSSDLDDYAKTADVMQSLIEIAEQNELSQRSDGVTLRLYSYYPDKLGDANHSYFSDATFKTVAGESIFGSGDIALDDYADKASIISMANYIYAATSRISTNSSGTAINFFGWQPSGDWLTGSFVNSITIDFKTVNGASIIGTGDITIDSPDTATADELGLVRPWYDTNLGNNAEQLLSRQMNEQTSVNDRYYGISAVNGRLYVNVPWESGEVDLSDYADKDTSMSMLSDAMGSLSYEKGSDHAMHINYSRPTAWGTLEHGSSDYLSIHFVTLNGRSLFGMGDISYSIEDLGGYSAATIDQKLVDITTGGTVDISGYATKDEVIGMAKNQYNAYSVSRSTSTNYTTIYHNFWLPNTIDTGEEDRVFGLYFSNINGNRIVGTSSSQVGNLTISDLGGVSTDDLADYADKAGTMSLMELVAHESELAYIESTQRLKMELFYPDAWGETNMDESIESNVYVRTIKGQHIFSATSDFDGVSDIDPTPWAVKIDGIDEVPGYLTSFIGTSFSGMANGVIYSSQRICPYVISGNTATVYYNWISEASLQYNTATGTNGSARLDLVFVYDGAAYVYNGYTLSGIGESTSDLADLQRMRALYPSATLLNHLDSWFNISAGDVSTALWTFAKIMDYDPDSGTCRIRFGVRDAEQQVYIIHSYTGTSASDARYLMINGSVSSSGSNYVAYFDIIVPYNGSDFVSLDYKYIVSYFGNYN